MKLKEKYNTWSFKKKVFLAVITVILILLILMCIVDIGILLINGSFVIGTDGDWISFWGNALGSLLGVIGAVGVSYWSTKKQLEETKRNDLNNAFKLNDMGLLNQMFEQLNEMYYKFADMKSDFRDMKVKGNLADKEQRIDEVRGDFNSVLDSYGKFLNGQVQLFVYPDKDMINKWNELMEHVTRVRDKINGSEIFLHDKSEFDKIYINFLDAIVEFSEAIVESKQRLSNIK